MHSPPGGSHTHDQAGGPARLLPTTPQTLGAPTRTAVVSRPHSEWVQGQRSAIAPAQSPPRGPICVAHILQTPQRWVPAHLSDLRGGHLLAARGDFQATHSEQPGLPDHPQTPQRTPLSFQASPNPVTLSPLSRLLEVKVDTWDLEVGAARLATLHAGPGAPPWRTLPRSPTAQHTPAWVVCPAAGAA